ncbi:PREDICTED: DNA polymerase alpha subunit B isoform X1 [Ceratotherium simum simum]|uniref:DNA polymerase alpha subunit B n=1 Tax=Ceratotherium simum simum TaxID=73337 RepID=A0ABM0I0B9_CERSS|nr:PREDICTED: DNA polymerase alpha subunit B isoform X1 [Ceratotherium simum simum]
MAVSAEHLLEELRIFGLDCEKALLEKLVELCILYGQNEEGMVGELIAFCTSTNKAGLTSETLNSFEHEFLSKRLSKARHSACRDSGHAGARDIVSIQELIEVEEEEETLLNSYTTPSKGSQKRAVITPESSLTKRSVSTRSPHQLLSPSSFSPSATPSQKYNSRNNRGEVVTSFGSVQGMSWSGRGGAGNLSLKVLGCPESLTGSYKSMFQKLPDIREVLTCKIEELGSELKEHYKIEAFTPVLVPAQEPVTLLGQIGCDSNGKLNNKSVILEGDREHSSGAQIPVDLSELKEYSLFPGQVVIMEGINTTGRKLVATKLYEGVPLPFHQPTEEDGDFEQSMVLAACGPYTTSDSITYEPLLDLIAVINRDRPDVCILFGPFLDAKHEQVESCLLTSPFEDVFKQCLRTIVEGTRSSGSHLVFVPSLRDVHHEPVYPQPPFSYSDLPHEDKKRVQFVSEPCSLSINGTIFGLTSTDLLFHMGAEEISSSSGTSDRFSRILKHILTQRSYYPLYPPQEDMAIDYENFYAYAQLPVTPDVFIIPSELRYFVKDILGCVCVNPGRLTKGQVGGTYGRLYLRRQTADGEGRHSPCVAAQVVRI